MSVTHGQRNSGLVTIRIEGNIDAINGSNFFLPVGSANGWLDHEELASALVPLKFHAAHSDHLRFVEEGLG